jgi:hypothetical protein
VRGTLDVYRFWLQGSARLPIAEHHALVTNGY